MICSLKLEAQESQWSNPFQIQRPENQRSQWCKSQSRVRRKWDERSQLKWWSRKKRANSSYLHLLFCLGPQQIGWCPSTVRKTESANSNANLWKQLSHIHSEIMFNMGIHGHSSLHIKLTISNSSVDEYKEELLWRSAWISGLEKSREEISKN